MAPISMQHLTKRYADGFTAVDDVSMEVADGEFVVLVGPSGSGKSTILRMIAGLEDITAGDLFIDDERVNGKAPRDRDVAMVFQSYALYPHLTVYENIAFPLRLHKVDKGEIDRRVRATAALLELDEHLERKPANLSGGQRQRVAMGRAIIREARVFLFDEPLSNLDAKLRGQVRIEISRLQKRLGVTTVYVTHDQVEALTLGDRVVVLRRGKLQQVGPPRELYRRPTNLFVAGFIGSPPMNLLPADIAGHNLHLPFGVVPYDLSQLSRHVGGEDRLIAGVRAEHLADARLLDDDRRARGVSFMATVDVLEWLGDEQVAYVPFEAPEDIRHQLAALQRELDSESLVTQMIVKLGADSDVREGDEIELWFDPDNLHLFDRTGANLTVAEAAPVVAPAAAVSS